MNLQEVILFSGLFIVILIIGKAIFGSIKNPATLFSGIWAVVGAVSNLGLYEYFLPSTFVNITMFVGAIVFFIVYSILLKGIHNTIFTENLQLEDTGINYKFFWITNVLSIIILIPQLLSAIRLWIKYGGFWYIRSHGSEIYSSGLVASLADNVIRPWFVGTTIMACVVLFSDIKRSKKISILLLAVVENIELVFLTAGRAPLVNMAFYLVISIVLFSGDTFLHLIKKEKKKLILVSVLGVGVILVTQLRSANNMDADKFLEIFHLYYFSGPSYLTRLLDGVKKFGPQGELLYGTATLGFIANIFYNILIVVTGKPQGSLYLISSQLTSRQYKVGSHSLCNAMCTGFYPFIIDWGYPGIVIGPTLFAVLAAYITIKLKKEKNIMNCSLYIYLLYLIIRTVFKWDLLNIDFSVLFIMLFICTKRNRIGKYKIVLHQKA